MSAPSRPFSGQAPVTVRGRACGDSVPGVRPRPNTRRADESAAPSSATAAKRVPIRRRAMPCPHCDAELDRALAAELQPSCPHCQLPLAPVEIAGLGRRTLAALVDLAALSLTALPIAWGLHRLIDPLPLAPGARGLDLALTVFASNFGSVLLRLGPLLVLMGVYFMISIAVMGRTPGQRLLSMAVVDRHGLTPNLAVTGVRTIAQLVGIVAAALGPLWIAFDSERRTFHDRVAGTYVVRSA